MVQTYSIDVSIENEIIFEQTRVSEKGDIVETPSNKYGVDISSYQQKLKRIFLSVSNKSGIILQEDANIIVFKEMIHTKISILFKLCTII